MSIAPPRIWTPEAIAHAKTVLAKHTRIVHAAQELGITMRSLCKAFESRGDRASKYLVKPDWAKTMPEGQRLRGNSTLLDSVGGVREKWVKTERDSEDPPDPPVPTEGFSVKKVSVNTDAQGFERQRWTQHVKDEQTRFEEFKSAVAEWAKTIAPLPRLKSPKNGDADLFTIIPLGDPHIGLLAWGKETGDNHDLKIAEADLVRAIDLLVDRSPSSARAALVNVGDFFHAQDDRQVTPASGHKLDVDARSGKVLQTGIRILERLCCRMLEKFRKVECVNVPGNHDPHMAMMIAELLKRSFKNEPRMIVHDAFDPFVYLRHGKNLIGVHHGDGVKMENLGEVMATRRAKDWGETEYRMWITGHIHHKRVLELPGCDVESFNTLAGKDFWTHWKGYEARRYLSAITLHSEYGPAHREIVDLRLIRATKEKS